jgi:hypothetical protein
MTNVLSSLPCIKNPVVYNSTWANRWTSFTVVASKRRESITQWCDIISQKNGILKCLITIFFFFKYVLFKLDVRGYLYEIVTSLRGIINLFSNCSTAPSGPGPPHYRGLTITLRHTTLGRTPLDEWSAHRRGLYLTTHNTHKRQTSMSPAGFEPAITASERPQTRALDRAATGIGRLLPTKNFISLNRQSD